MSQAERLGRSCLSMACSALSLARSAQAQRDHESCFFVSADGVHRFIDSVDYITLINWRRFYLTRGIIYPLYSDIYFSYMWILGILKQNSNNKYLISRRVELHYYSSRICSTPAAREIYDTCIKSNLIFAETTWTWL